MQGNLFEIDGYLVDTSKLLGSGAYGQVFPANKRNDPRQFCAKVSLIIFR